MSEDLAPNEVTTQSLDDIASSFQATQPQQQNVSHNTASKQNFDVPDPVLDSDGFKRMFVSESVALKEELRSIQSQLSQYQQEQVRSAEEKEIRGIADDISKASGISDPEMVEVALGLRYRKDPSFKKIWDNRHQNQTAFKKALDIVKNDIRSKYSVKQDPKLTENQRAMDEALKSTTGKQSEKPKLEDKLMSKTDADFDLAWQDLVSG